MALMFAQDSSAGLSAASMVHRWMPFDQKSLPPRRTMTRVGRAAAHSKAAVRRRHWAVLIAPL